MTPQGLKDPRAMIAEAIEQKGLAPPGALERARQVSSRTGQPIEQVLNGLGVLSDERLTDLYREVTGLPLWRRAERPPTVEPDALGLAPEYLRRARLLPIEAGPTSLTVAVADPLDTEALEGIRFATGLELELLIARPGELRDLGAGTAPLGASVDQRRLESDLDRIADGSGEGAGARLVAQAFEAAVLAGASDIHFEPRRHDLRVRLRIDGRLVEHRTAPLDLAAPAVSRIKVVANLDLGERRLPQDGRASFVVQGRAIDVRVATSPTVFGESAVLRLLDRQAVALDLEALGLAPDVTTVLRRAASAPNGLFLVTGPTGSGKTTTLYALLAAFADSPRKVMSIEDPVEFHFEHVVQTAVQPAIGLTFASALRSFLRQDPDVILVGEIRDRETAQVAVQAAMTGHLVLASVHANDASAVVTRLRDLGIEPYQLAAAFRGAAAQRLVRRLCRCAEDGVPTAAEAAFLNARGLAPLRTVKVPRGCSHCGGTGFKGRIPIAEAYIASEALTVLIAEDAPQTRLLGDLRASGFAPMLEDGITRVREGLTTVSEVMAALDG